ncbi:hypothetical protein E6C67_03940 (plasmid) [Azospirillum sp. TSA2s]|nr:hypothetical protein E6C67_03940 [Azospirillum sp. TSA2s]
MIPLMIDRKAVLFRLYSTPEQAAQMAQVAGACRFVYNLALEQRRDWYRPGRQFNVASQCREVTQLRAEVAWLKACPVHTLQQALRDLERAYQIWWAGRVQASTPHRKGLNNSVRFSDPVSLVVERTGALSGRMKLPKLEWVRLRGWTALPGAICTITMSRHAGHWVAAAQTSQTCTCCGHVDAANRPSQAVFTCGRCGHRANADTNAAITSLRRADSAACGGVPRQAAR